MEDIIFNMIATAKANKDYEQAEQIYKLLSKMAQTINCPCDWRSAGYTMYESFIGDDWVMDNCRLYEFE